MELIIYGEIAEALAGHAQQLSPSLTIRILMGPSLILIGPVRCAAMSSSSRSDIPASTFGITTSCFAIAAGCHAWSSLGGYRESVVQTGEHRNTISKVTAMEGLGGGGVGPNAARPALEYDQAVGRIRKGVPT